MLIKDSPLDLSIQLESIYFNPPLYDFNIFLVKTGNTNYDKRTISKRKYLTFKCFEVQGHLYEHKIKGLWLNYSTQTQPYTRFENQKNLHSFL